MQKKTTLKTLSFIGIVFAIFLFSFPKIEPVYSIGLDSSYIWGLNYLFNNDYETLKNLVYPIGVLGFLKMPTTEGLNLFYSLVFFSVLKIWFICSFLKIAIQSNTNRKTLAILFVGFISYFANYDILIIGLCVIQSILYIQTPKLWKVGLLVSIAYLGLCIKSSIGISAFSVIFMAFLIDLYSYKNYRKSFQFIGIGVVVILGIGFLVYRDFSLIFNNFLNILKLSSGYSSALALHPENNWFALSGFLLTLVLFPLLVKNKNARIVFFLFLPTLFTMWKHAMVREDASHNAILIYFMILFWGVLLIYSSQKKILIFSLSFLSIGLFHTNLSTIQGFNGININLSGVSNFNEIVLNYPSLLNKYKEESIQNIKRNKLDERTLKIIGNKTIDIYPWEHSYIPANNLNWNPRKTIEIGASSSQWASELASNHYKKEKKSPDFVLFHFQKNKYEGNLGSIDNRYILNDEPKLIYNLVNNYTVTRKTEKFMLFEKNSISNFNEIELEEKKNTKFNEWIPIPKLKNGIVRCKITSEYSTIGSLKKFLYKDEAYFIDYRINENKILTFRYIPSTAVDGIWCSPLLISASTTYEEPEATHIRFRKTHTNFTKNNIEYQFEKITLNQHLKNISTTNYANLLFMKFKANKDTILIQEKNDFESEKNNSISEKGISNSGEFSNLIKEGGYSFTFKYALDSIWKKADTSIKELYIEANINYCSSNKKTNFIIETKDTKNNFWFSKSLQKNKTWKYHFLTKKINRKDHSNGSLNIYIWNNGKGNVNLDDFVVTIKSIN